MNASDPGLSKTWKHQSCQKIVGSSFFFEKCNIIKPNYILKKNLLESQNSWGVWEGFIYFSIQFNLKLLWPCISYEVIVILASMHCKCPWKLL